MATPRALLRGAGWPVGCARPGAPAAARARAMPARPAPSAPRAGRQQRGDTLSTLVTQAAGTSLEAAVDTTKRDGLPSVDYLVALTLMGERHAVRLTLQVVDQRDPGTVSAALDLSAARTEAYERNDPTRAGTRVFATLKLPATFQPGVLLLTKLPEPQPGSELPLLLATVTLQAVGGSSPPREYAAYTYLDVQQGERWVFPADVPLPGFEGHTPPGLAWYRERELQALRGSTEDSGRQRGGADRIYAFDTYNDLGTKDSPRPTLGGGPWKYPRRLRTGRPLQADGSETPTEGVRLPWIPIDERFNTVKYKAFTADSSDCVGRALGSLLGTPKGASIIASLVPAIREMYKHGETPSFSSLAVVDALYEGMGPRDTQQRSLLAELLPVGRLKAEELYAALRQRLRVWNGRLRRLASLPGPGSSKPAAAQQGPAPHAAVLDNLEEAGLGGATQQSIAALLQVLQGLLEKWPVPGARAGRAWQWRTDEEFGRSALAGQNPLSIRAVTPEDLQVFAVRDADVAGLLGGRSLAAAVAQQRLWTLDFFPGYADFLAEVAALPGSSSVLHAGRCLLFTREDGQTVPVSIELQTAHTPMRVLTPHSRAEVWALAKTIVSSLDSGVHQLISHWLRTHAVVEPYVIATRRHLSVLHPVFKLLQPHFRYTLRINCNARKTLISAGGTIETAFTPGPFSLRLSARAYEGWRFDEQALPADLLKRGVAERQADGTLRVKIPHYSFAEDGLLLWDAIEKFAEDYLRIYYNDLKPGEQVTDDREIAAWWACIQREGHPDISEGWPAITNIASLRDVLASIIWTASCHHAAVNFGQYDNAGYVPYKPSKVVAGLPQPGSSEEARLFSRFEEALLDSITPPEAALQCMVTVKILSAHAADEEYLDRAEHKYIREPEAAAVHARFVAALQAAERRMEARNAARPPNDRAYSLLMPSNPPCDPLPGGGRPARGVPYSISI